MEFTFLNKWSSILWAQLSFQQYLDVEIVIFPCRYYKEKKTVLNTKIIKILWTLFQIQWAQKKGDSITYYWNRDTNSIHFEKQRFFFSPFNFTGRKATTRVMPCLKHFPIYKTPHCGKWTSWKRHACGMPLHFNTGLKMETNIQSSFFSSIFFFQWKTLCLLSFLLKSFNKSEFVHSCHYYST